MKLSDNNTGKECRLSIKIYHVFELACDCRAEYGQLLHDRQNIQKCGVEYRISRLKSNGRGVVEGLVLSSSP